MSLSCDNLTLSGDGEMVGGGAYPVEDGCMYCYPSGELAHAVCDCGLSWSEVRCLLLTGVRASFCKPPPAFVRAFEAALDEGLGAGPTPSMSAPW